MSHTAPLVQLSLAMQTMIVYTANIVSATQPVASKHAEPGVQTSSSYSSSSPHDRSQQQHSTAQKNHDQDQEAV